jgi:hypothetical protein
LRSFGWEPVEICELEDEAAKLEKCRELGQYLFKDLPATAASRTEHVLFYGYLADDYTRFIALKLVKGQITFRMANDTLGRLQMSTGKLIKKILNTPLNDKAVNISNNQVVIYERGNDYVVLSGRVVPQPLAETLRSDRKSALLTVIPLILAILILAFGFGFMGITAQNNGLLGVSLGRLLTALLTTALVSLLGLIDTYVEIYRNKIVIW